MDPAAPNQARRHAEVLAEIDRVRYDAKRRLMSPDSIVDPDPQPVSTSRWWAQGSQAAGRLEDKLDGLSNYDLLTFGTDDFDPREFAENVSAENVAALTVSPATNCASADAFDLTVGLQALSKVETSLKKLRVSAVTQETEACENVKRVFVAATTLTAALTSSLATMRSKLSAQENAVDNATSNLTGVLAPIRTAVAEKECLLDARDATAIMTERPEGIEVERAAKLLSKLTVAVQEAQTRGLASSSLKQAAEKIDLWTKDLSCNLEEWFFMYLEGEHVNTRRTAQCAAAALELNGAKDLIQRYVASRPIFQKVPTLSKPIKSPVGDPNGERCVELLEETRRWCIETLRSDIPHILVAFPEPSLVITNMVQRLITHKMAVTAELILVALEEHAILAEMAFAVEGHQEDNSYFHSNPGIGTALHKKYKKREPEVLSANHIMLKVTAGERRRRYLCTLSEACRVLQATGEEMAGYRNPGGFDIIGFASRALLGRKEGFVHLEQLWLQSMVDTAFRDAIETPRPLAKTSLTQSDPALYSKYRSYTSRLSTFSAMTQRGISCCLESLRRCMLTNPPEPHAASESLAKIFVGSFITVAEESLSIAINVIPKSEKIASKADYWAQGGSPIGLWAAALEQVQNSLMAIDHFFVSISNSDESTATSLPSILPTETADSIREELRSSLTRLDGFSESGLELSAMAIASRVARTLEKEQKRTLEYAVEGEATGECMSQIGGLDSMDGEEDLTPAFVICCAFLDEQVSALSASLTEKNLEYALSIVANAVRLAVLSHWQKLKGPITPLGGLRLMGDVRALQRCFSACEAAEMELSALVEIGNIFVLPPPKIWTLVEDGALKRMEGRLLARMLELRPDYKTAKLKKLATALAPDNEGGFRVNNGGGTPGVSGTLTSKPGVSRFARLTEEIEAGFAQTFSSGVSQGD